MKNKKEQSKITESHFLNVGCGPVSRWIPNTEGLDIQDFGQKWVCSVFDFKPPYLYDAVFLHHVYEHFDNPVELIDKISDFMKDGGVLDIRVPIYPHKQAFVDPTHKSFVVFPETFFYYTKDSFAGHIYSKREFELVGHETDRYEWEGHCALKLLPRK